MSKTISSAKTSRGYTLKLEMTETVNQAANTSTIAYSLKLYSGSGSGDHSFSGYRTGWKIVINGVTVEDQAQTVSETLGHNSNITLVSGTTTVAHEEDGSKTIACSANMYQALGDHGAGNMSLSGSWTLTDIPRKSSLTVPTLNIGQSVTLSVTRESASFTDKLEYAFSGQTDVIASDIGDGVATLTNTVSWTVPSTFLNLLPNSTAGAGTLTLTTYNGSDVVGSTVYDVSFIVPSSVVPSVSIAKAPYNANAWIAANHPTWYVAGLSCVDVTPTATAGTGATIASIAISGGAGDGNTTSGMAWRSGLLSSGTKSITVKAIDTRGRSATATTSISVVNYNKPTISAVAAERGTYSGGVWTANVNGDHIKVTVSASIWLTGNTCTISVTCGSTQTINGTSGSVYFTSTDAEHVYEISVTATDAVGNTSNTTTVTVGTSAVPLFWDEDRIGIGKIAQNANSFEVAYQSVFESTVSVSGVTFPDATHVDSTNAGLYLKMNSAGTGLEWAAGGGGGGAQIQQSGSTLSIS